MLSNEIESKEFKSCWQFRIRLIASVLVCTFLYEQVLWAAGDPNSQKNDKRKDLARQIGYLPSYLQKRNQEALKNIREAISLYLEPHPKEVKSTKNHQVLTLAI